MFAQLVDVAGDAAFLALEELLDRAREARMREPVRRQHLDRHQAAEDLVFTLCSSFKYFYLFLNGELDRLVVAAVEVQQRHVLERAPVTSIERLLVAQE